MALEIGKIYWKRSPYFATTDKYILILGINRNTDVYCYRVQWLLGYKDKNGEVRSNEHLWEDSWTEFKPERK